MLRMKRFFCFCDLLKSKLFRRSPKQKTIRQLADGLFCSVGMPGFEPGAPCPPDKYSNRAELHPVAFEAVQN